MKQLFSEEVSLVSGGGAVLVVGGAVLAWLSFQENRDQVGDFFEAAFEAFDRNQQSHK